MIALVALGILSLANHAQGQESVLRFTTETGTLIVRNYATTTLDTGGSTVVKGSGNPMTVEETGQGLLLTGKSMQVTIGTLPNGASVLEQARVSGGGQVVLDGEAAYRGALARAKEGSPLVKPLSFTRTQIDSNEFAYARDGKEGLLILPEAATIVSESKGTLIRDEKGEKVSIPFTQSLRLSGTQAQVSLLVDEKGKIADLRTAHLEGPVPFKLMRSESITRPLPKVEVTDIDGKCDQFDANFASSEEPTLTASGNVQIKGVSRGTPVEITGSKAVITLDKDRKPTRYFFVGTPTVTRIQPSKGGSR